MPEAVIVDAIRTPVGRAFKGSLASLRPDETLAFVMTPCWSATPRSIPPCRGADRGLWHAAGSAGEQHRPHRRAALRQARPADERHHRLALLRVGLDAIRLAANNVIAGQGDTYIAGGVEFVSRYNEGSEAARPQDQNEHLKGNNGAPSLHRDGRDGREVAERYGVTREQQDEYAQQSQERAVAAQQSGVFEREIIPVKLDDGTESPQTTDRDRPRRSRSSPRWSRRSGRGDRHRGQLMSFERWPPPRPW